MRKPYTIDPRAGSAIPHFHVIEFTPGYMPDNTDEPTIDRTRRAALRTAWELAQGAADSMTDEHSGAPVIDKLVSSKDGRTATGYAVRWPASDTRLDRWVELSECTDPKCEHTRWTAATRPLWMQKDRHIRTLKLAPYVSVDFMGEPLPTFTLAIYDARGITNPRQLGYRLTMHTKGKRACVVFQGSDFGCSPLQACDSDRTVAAILTFLTLKPGDTDRDYFASYSARQLEWAGEHAEALYMEASARLGEETFQ